MKIKAKLKQIEEISNSLSGHFLCLTRRLLDININDLLKIFLKAQNKELS